MDNTQKTSPSSVGGDRRLVMFLVLLITIVISGLGAKAIFTTEYFGSTTKLGGSIVVLYGSSAQWAGGFLFFLGLLPIAILFKNKKSALRWFIGVFSASTACFLISAIK